jgi:hypothetical protein
MLSTPMSMSMDTTSKHYAATSSENTAPDQEAVDLSLYEAAKDGDLHAAFIAIQKGADLGSQHDIVRHAPYLFLCPRVRQMCRQQFCTHSLCVRPVITGHFARVVGDVRHAREAIASVTGNKRANLALLRLA